MTSELLIVGIGNLMRGDDAVGILLAEEMGKRLGVRAHVESNPYMLWNLLQGGTEQPHLVLIDAAQSEEQFPVGSWHRFSFPAEIDKISDTVLRNTHSIDVVSMLKLGETLGILPPHVRIYAIAGSDFEMSDDISPILAGHLAKLGSEIEKDLLNWLEVESCTSSPSHDPSAASP